MHFQDLNLLEPLLLAVQAEGYSHPTPIQEQAIPHILAGRDLVGCAQTGTGKTAAFALPILHHLMETRHKHRRGTLRALVISPTRELAAQIHDSFKIYGQYTKLKQTVIYGGVGQNPQVQALRRGSEILVATPGRLLDLMNQGVITLDTVEIFVLDEADRMLDMGFINDVRRIIKALPSQRQTLLLSATMPPDIQKLADDILTDPVRVAVTPQSTTVEKIDQSVFFVDRKNKRHLLEHILLDEDIRRALVFTRTKHGANKLAQQLDRADIQAEAIHGNKSQTARQKALANFKAGKTRVLVATDLASRGIDVDDVTHVINYDLPNEPESYVHRIGRTGRAGASGIAYSFCDHEERRYLRDIERLIREDVPVVPIHPFPAVEVSAASSEKKSSSNRRRSNNHGRSANGNGHKPSNGTNGNRRRSSDANSTLNESGAKPRSGKNGNRRRNNRSTNGNRQRSKQNN